jgi:hypothetical protein
MEYFAGKYLHLVDPGYFSGMGGVGGTADCPQLASERFLADAIVILLRKAVGAR